MSQCKMRMKTFERVFFKLRSYLHILKLFSNSSLK